jgi:hypothetical protein
MGEIRDEHNALVRVLKGRDNVGDLGINAKMLLKLIFKRQDTRLWGRLTWFRTGTSGNIL